MQRWVVLGLLLWLFVGPRVEPPVLHGLRVEDLVFLALAIVCLTNARMRGRPGGRTVAVAGVVASGLVSAGVAIARGTVEPIAAVLFAVRPLEYWIAFPAALLVVRDSPVWMRRMSVLLGAVTVLQTGFAVLQYWFQVPVGFSHAAYTRAAGLTVGPYELGAISAALLVYWVAHRRWVLAALATIGLAASISRVSILGACVAVAVLLTVAAVRQIGRVQRLGARAAFRPRVPLGRAAIDVVAVGAAVIILGLTLGVLHLPSAPQTSQRASGSQATAQQHVQGDDPVSVEEQEDDGATTSGGDGGSTIDAPAAPTVKQPSESVATRLANTSVLGSWHASKDAADAVPHPRTAAEYQAAAYAHLQEHIDVEGAARAGGEPSNLVRFFRWHLLLDTVDDPLDVVFGLGPSFAGPSVDGSYLRMFADGGLLGLLAWLALVVMWVRRSPLWMVCVTIALLVGALFIDIVYAQRPMALYWTLLAVAVAQRSAAPRSEARDDVDTRAATS